jgi:Bacterial cell division membrane protein
MSNSHHLKRPVFLVILADIFAFSLLCFYRKSADWYILAAGLLVVALIIVCNQLIVSKLHGDEYLFLIVSMLASLGFIMLYRLDRMSGLKQVVWFAGGIILFFASVWIYKKFRWLDSLMVYYTVAAIALFAATKVLGRDINGSINWISIAGFVFQPSEPIKVVFVMILACCYGGSNQYITRKHSVVIKPEGYTRKLLVSGITYMFIGFLILQREWGTSLLLFFIYLSVIFVFENDIRLYLANGIFAVMGCVGGYFLLGHIRTRVDMWVNPWIDIDGKGYQITQSLFAIASGGFFGTGIGLGSPDMIPAVNTDFIFSAICEEMGIFGGMAVILLYFLLCYRGFKIVLTTHNTFDKVVSLGITIMFGIQTFIIVGGVIKLIPMTGITLPFISYGGSSLTSSFIALGILQAISAGTVREIGGNANEEKPA